MSSRKETERAKLLQEKCQTYLTQMLRDEDNKYCVDCDSKGPRWASWNLGVFLCIRCAGIHRNLGVHISRVKSVNLDSWTPEQVVSLQQMGNSRARAVFEAQLPDGFRRPQTDTSLESFIRAKYEHKKYLAREWVPPPAPKVDWAREIDEEIEKQKRKKKASNHSNSIGISSPLAANNVDKKSWGNNSTSKNTPLPAPLPKPKSLNSPKNTRNDNHSTSSDLLGLSTPAESTGSEQHEENKDYRSGDNFTGFLSAPVSGHTTSTINGATNVIGINSEQEGANSLAKEEEDFFNQTNLGGGDRDKTGKLTKDSILALYGSPVQTTTTSLGQFNNNSLVGFNSTFNQQTAFMSMGGMQQQQQQAQQQNQFGQQITNSGPASFNLAGMPQGLLGPHAPHQAHHLMTPPSSMYNAPVMTAPGAFTTTANQQLHQQIGMSQQGFAQFPPQVYGGGIQQQQQSSNFANLLGSANTIAPTGQPANAGASTNLNQQFGNLNLGNVWQ